PQGRSENQGAIRKGAQAEGVDCEKIAMRISPFSRKTSLLPGHPAAISLYQRVNPARHRPRIRPPTVTLVSMNAPPTVVQLAPSSLQRIT
ncbi:MAG: hypothetical protein WCA89_07265, partial [Terracidiphilus sp.]